LAILASIRLGGFIHWVLRIDRRVGPPAIMDRFSVGRIAMSAKNAGTSLGALVAVLLATIIVSGCFLVLLMIFKAIIDILG